MRPYAIEVVYYDNPGRGTTPVPTTVVVAPATFSVNVGQTQQLTATVFDQNGTVMTGQTITWGSSNSAIASVNGTGLVTGVGAGTATITATSGPASGTATATGTGIIVSDSFDRADNATSLGAADTGQAWTATGLTAGIQGGMAYFPTVSGFGIATVETLHADVDVTCSLILRTSADQSRGVLLLRGDGSVANRWSLNCDSTGTNLVLSKVVASVSTNVQTAAFAVTLGQSYAIRVVAKGSAWTVYVNGVSTITATDAALSTLTKCGIGAVRSTSAVGSPFFDAFKVVLP